MPRGQKSKHRAREKRRQARGDTHSPEGVQATSAEGEGSPSSSSPPFEGSPQGSYAASILQGPQRARITSSVAAGASGIGAVGGAEGQDEGGARSSEAPPSTERSPRDPLTCRVSMLLQFLLQKYHMNEPFTKGGMIKIVHRRFKEHFPEILKRASEHIELVFGLDLKEVDAKSQSYIIVNKLELTDEENLSGGRGVPRNALLLPILGLVCANGKQATEMEMWEFLNLLGVYDGRKHFIFGEPRKLITEDLVHAQYLEYRQIPDSHPPCYEFLWGPRAHAEANKNVIEDFLVKVNDNSPHAFQALCEEARIDEGERAPGGELARAGPDAGARASHFMEESSRSSSLQ